MATILTKKSDTASSVPLAADLTNAAGGAELAVNTADKRLYSKTSGGSVVELGTNPSTFSLPNGTANGVPYLNGSKVLTSGSALTFDGTNLGVGTAPVASYRAAINGDFWQGNGAGAVIGTITNNAGWYDFGGSSNVNGVQMSHQTASRWLINGSEAMRLTTTGLGIGTSSPGAKLDVTTAQNGATRVRVNNQNSGGSAVSGLLLDAYGGSWTIDVPASTTFVNPLQFIFGGSEKMRIDSSGNLGIGTSAPNFKVQATGSIAASDATYTGPNNFIGAILSNDSGGSGAAPGLDMRRWTGSATNHGAGRIGTDSTAAIVFYSDTKSTNTYATTERMRLDASGNLLVGTTDNSTNQQGFAWNINSGGSFGRIGHANATASGTAYLAFQYNGGAIGTITQSGTTAVLYNVTSDQRLKQNIVDAPEFGSVIDSIKVRSYDWKADGNHQRAGFIAQELVTVAPEAVHQPADPEEMMAVDYSKLVPMLVKEIQSLRKRLAVLESK